MPSLPVHACACRAWTSPHPIFAATAAPYGQAHQAGRRGAAPPTTCRQRPALPAAPSSEQLTVHAHGSAVQPARFGNRHTAGTVHVHIPTYTLALRRSIDTGTPTPRYSAPSVHLVLVSAS